MMPFTARDPRAAATLNEPFAVSRKLEKAIGSNPEGLGYG